LIFFYLLEVRIDENLGNAFSILFLLIVVLIKMSHECFRHIEKLVKSLEERISRQHLMYPSEFLYDLESFGIYISSSTDMVGIRGRWNELMRDMLNAVYPFYRLQNIQQQHRRSRSRRHVSSSRDYLYETSSVTSRENTLDRNQSGRRLLNSSEHIPDTTSSSEPRVTGGRPAMDLSAMMQISQQLIPSVVDYLGRLSGEPLVNLLGNLNVPTVSSEHKNAESSPPVRENTETLTSSNLPDANSSMSATILPIVNTVLGIIGGAVDNTNVNSDQMSMLTNLWQSVAALNFGNNENQNNQNTTNNETKSDNTVHNPSDLISHTFGTIDQSAQQSATAVPSSSVYSNFRNMNNVETIVTDTSSGTINDISRVGSNNNNNIDMNVTIEDVDMIDSEEEDRLNRLLTDTLRNFDSRK
jgi:hypothetical protein